MTVRHKVSVDFDSLFFHKNIGNTALVNAAIRLNGIGLRAAKAELKRRRKKSGSSPLLSSFADHIEVLGEHVVLGVVQAGGPSAPYAVWVDQGHKLRNGEWWEGYEFMNAGAERIEEAAYSVMADEFDRVAAIRIK